MSGLKNMGKKGLLLGLLSLTVLVFVFFEYRIAPSRAFSGFTGVGASILSVPVTVVADIPYSIKEQIEDVIVRSLARNAQTKLQNGVLNKINQIGKDPTGQDGRPVIVTDWRAFLGGAPSGGQFRGEHVFRALIADMTRGQNPSVCPYMRDALATIFTANDSLLSDFQHTKYKLDSLNYFKSRNACTLPSNFNFDAFRNDFTNGGWSTWRQLIKPQNNLYGVYADSLNELVRQRGFEEGIDKSEAESGSGFASRRSGCRGTTSGLSCVVLGDIKTPGQILENTVQRSIDEDFSWITSADEFSELLAGIANALFNSLLTKLDNLSSGTAGLIGNQAFNQSACVADCVNAGRTICNGLNEPELSSCQNQILFECTATCAANVVP